MVKKQLNKNEKRQSWFKKIALLIAKSHAFHTQKSSGAPATSEKCGGGGENVCYGISGRDSRFCRRPSGGVPAAQGPGVAVTSLPLRPPPREHHLWPGHVFAVALPPPPEERRPRSATAPHSPRPPPPLPLGRTPATHRRRDTDLLTFFRTNRDPCGATGEPTWFVLNRGLWPLRWEHSAKWVFDFFLND